MIRVLKPAWTVAWKLTLFLVVWGALYAAPLFGALRWSEVHGGPDAPSGRLLLEFIGALTLLSAAWVMTSVVDRRPLASLGFCFDNFVRDTVVGLCFGAAMMGLSVIILRMAGWATRQAVARFSPEVLFLGAAAMLFNTVTQEVLVRGYIQQTLQSEWGTAAAVTMAALIFVLLHAAAISAVLPAVNLFAAGVLLGLGYSLTRNLWLPIGLHFSWNFLEGPVLGLTVSAHSVDSGWKMLTLSGPEFFTGGSFGLEGGLVATMTTIIAIVALLGWHYSQRRQSSCR